MLEHSIEDIAHLQHALRALRLNRHFPDWRPIRAHLGGIAVRPAGEPHLKVDPDSGWPHPDEWLRVRADHRLAADLLARLAPLASAGDPNVSRKKDYLQALQCIQPMRGGGVKVSLIEQGRDTSRFEIVVDRIVLGRPVFVRWTLRLSESGAKRLAPDALAARASAHFERRLQRLATQDAVAAMLLLRAEDGLTVEEIVRGEVGPVVRVGSSVRLTAVLSRAAPSLRRTSVDDPLAKAMTIPNADAGFGLSHHRKWAAPRAEVSTVKQWLRGQGSKNIVYGY